jgi:hypothetical protein
MSLAESGKAIFNKLLVNPLTKALKVKDQILNKVAILAHNTFHPRSTSRTSEEYSVIEHLEVPKESVCTRLRGLFRWVHLLNAITDDELKVICGTDGALYLVFLRYACKFFAVIAIMNCLVIVPIYIFGDN